VRNPFSAIFFDMDGTLVDTEKTAADVLALFFKDRQILLDERDASYIVGRTWGSCFDFLYSKYQMPPDRAACEAEILDRYHTHLKTHGFPEVKGAVNAVKELSQFGRLALVSGSHRNTIEWVLKTLQITQYFEQIFGAEDYTHGKPSPEPYLLAQKALGVTAQSTWVFEDSAAGILSAKRAGHRVYAITSTNYQQQDQSLADAHLIDLSGVNREWILSQ